MIRINSRILEKGLAEYGVGGVGGVDGGYLVESTWSALYVIGLIDEVKLS
jgi:hypothetical protein